MSDRRDRVEMIEELMRDRGITLDDRYVPTFEGRKRSFPRRDPITTLIDLLLLPLMVSPHELMLFEMGLNALDGICKSDHTNVDVLCFTCGWHEHLCNGCGHIWSHDSRLVIPKTLLPEGMSFDYKREHLCPTCGREQLERHRR